MLRSQPPLQAIAPLSSCTLQQVEKWNLMAARKKIRWVWQYLDEEDGNYKVVCRLCVQKLEYYHTTDRQVCQEISDISTDKSTLQDQKQ